MKKWWQSKTIWVNILTVAIGILSAIGGQSDLIPVAALKWVLMAVGVLNVILRFITNQPIVAKVTGK